VGARAAAIAMELQIRVATYNVHKCRGLDRQTSPTRIAAVIAELNADVIALQEILDVPDGKAEYDQARRIKSELKEYESCFGENRILHGGSYGNMTLSRFPLQHCNNYDLTWRNRERRGCLRTDVMVGNGILLHVFNVHLGTGFIERRGQGRRLVSGEVLHGEDMEGPRIVMGDFNEWTRGLASRLMGSAFQSVEARAFLRYRRTYPGVLPVLHLDHLYYDAQLTLGSFRLHRSRKALIASDHLPIVADFLLNGSATPAGGGA